MSFYIEHDHTDTTKAVKLNINILRGIALAKVLIVEDTESWAALHSEFARSAGHTPVVAASAEEANLLINENNFDLVITDGLKGNWTRVYDTARNKGIKTLIVSESQTVEAEAARRRIKFLFKTDRQLVKKIESEFEDL